MDMIARRAFKNLVTVGCLGQLIGIRNVKRVSLGNESAVSAPPCARAISEAMNNLSPKRRIWNGLARIDNRQFEFMILGSGVNFNRSLG